MRRGYCRAAGRLCCHGSGASHLRMPELAFARAFDRADGRRVAAYAPDRSLRVGMREDLSALARHWHDDAVVSRGRDAARDPSPLSRGKTDARRVTVSLPQRRSHCDLYGTGPRARAVVMAPGVLHCHGTMRAAPGSSASLPRSRGVSALPASDSRLIVSKVDEQPRSGLACATRSRAAGERTSSAELSSALG